MSSISRRILVTGAGGFIGSHVAEAAVRAGFDVTALATYRSSGTAGWLDALAADVVSQMRIERFDIRDQSAMRMLLRGQDAVLHLAALIGIPYSYDAPESYVQTNVAGTLNILEAARASDCARVVLTSTSEVYGTAQTVPIDEMHPLNPQSPYAATKVGADSLGASYHRSFGLPVVIIRPFNNFGPRQSPRAVTPAIIRQILAGPTVRLGSTEPTRDLLFVADTARGFLAAIERDEAVGQVVNLATGYEISIGDLAMRIAGLMGVDIEIETDPLRVRPDASEVRQLLGDASRAAEILGWRPELSGEAGLDAGLRLTIDWMRANADAFGASTYAT